MPVFNPTVIVGTPNQITANGTTNQSQFGQITIAINPNPILPGTGSVSIPSGTTAERPVSPIEGEIRNNTTLGSAEIFQGGAWYKLAVAREGGSSILSVYNGTVPATSGTTTVPFDNTTPLITEGTEIWATTITPASVNSTFKLTVPYTVDCGTSNRIIISSIFRNSVNIGSAIWFAPGNSRPGSMIVSVIDSPATTTPVVYSMRTGIGAGAGTWYINSTSSGNNLGGALLSTYEIFEVIG